MHLNLHISFHKRISLTLVWVIFSAQLIAQTPAGSWSLWASGLPQGVYPRMSVAPNHDIFYALLGSGVKLGYIYKANTGDSLGHFTELPPVPRPATVQNNIVALGFNANSEPLAGIYRTNMSDPWLFCFNNQKQSWDTCVSDLIPTLGGHCLATSKKGIIYAGTRWAYIYKSTDNGKTFKAIDESKIISNSYPCYYPSFLNNSESNGAIFTISIDHNDRIYAGTETAGVVYSDDEGNSWHPADLFACKNNPNVYDTASPMSPIAKSGNVAGIGFTKENNVVWSGIDMWYFGWKNKLGFANMQDSTVTEVKGLPDYLVQTGQQISKIVTTTNGKMFLHSGSSSGSTQIGIYYSENGIDWSLFNTGITGINDGQSQGSLAVDGNKVFMATHDGKVWFYDASDASTQAQDIPKAKFRVYPNPASAFVVIQQPNTQSNMRLINLQGESVLNFSLNQREETISLEGLSHGLYHLILTDNQGHFHTEKLWIR